MKTAFAYYHTTKYFISTVLKAPFLHPKTWGVKNQRLYSAKTDKAGVIDIMKAPHDKQKRNFENIEKVKRLLTSNRMDVIMMPPKTCGTEIFLDAV